MTIEERKNEIARITNSASKPGDKLLALEKFIEQEKKADEQEKKDQQKVLDKIFADEQKKEQEETKLKNTQKIEVTNFPEDVDELLTPVLEKINTTLVELKNVDLTETNNLLKQLIKTLEKPCNVNLTLE